MKLVLYRTFLIWLLIIAAETVHGILRTIFLAPWLKVCKRETKPSLVGQRHISEMSQEIATRRVSEVIRVSASLAYASGYDWCQSGAVQLDS